MPFGSRRWGGLALITCVLRSTDTKRLADGRGWNATRALVVRVVSPAEGGKRLAQRSERGSEVGLPARCDHSVTESSGQLFAT
jgi:hypothetical protein